MKTAATLDAFTSTVQTEDSATLTWSGTEFTDAEGASIELAPCLANVRSDFCTERSGVQKSRLSRS